MLLLLALLTGCDDQPMSEEELAVAFEAEPDADARLRLLEVHVTRNPDSPKAHLFLGREYRSRGDARARAEIERAVELGVSDPVPRIELAYLLIEPALRRGVDPERADLDRAESLCEEAVRLDGSCANHHALIGVYDTQVDAGYASPDAVTAITAALEACRDPLYPGPWQATLGRVHRVEGRSAEAEQWLCRSVVTGNVITSRQCLVARVGEAGIASYAPTDLAGHLALADVRGREGDHEAAVKALDAAIALDPSRASSYAALGDARSAAGRPDACEAYEAAAGKDPGRFVALPKEKGCVAQAHPSGAAK